MASCFSYESSNSFPRVGIWQDIPHPSVTRYLSLMGWHFVILDMQHGPLSFETAYECVHILRASGVEPWIRISIDNPFQVQRALDIGAQAVVVPMVNSVEMARQLARSAKYPPQGVRSLGGDCEVHLGSNYPERANQETALIVQVEHIESALVVEEIMAVAGVDGCFVGPTDLALSMSLSRVDYAHHPAHRKMMRRVLDTCHSYGKIACCNTYSVEDARNKLTEGFDCVTQQSEVQLLMRTGCQLREQLTSSTECHDASDGPSLPAASRATVDVMVDGRLRKSGA